MIDTELVRQAVLANLPRKCRWPIFESLLDFSFARSETPLRSLEITDSRDSVDPALWLLFEFGEQGYDGGEVASLCVAASDGRVVGLTSDRAQPIFLLNCNIDAFVKTFQLLDNALRSGANRIAELSIEAEMIDPIIFPVSEWADVLRELSQYHDAKCRDNNPA